MTNIHIKPVELYTLTYSYGLLLFIFATVPVSHLYRRGRASQILKKYDERSIGVKILSKPSLTLGGAGFGLPSRCFLFWLQRAL